MNIREFREALGRNPGAALHFMLPDGDFVPAHFHITEVGRVRKDFIDCGGTVRSATSCLFQVWVADDVGRGALAVPGVRCRVHAGGASVPFGQQTHRLLGSRALRGGTARRPGMLLRRSSCRLPLPAIGERRRLAARRG